jgi:hypothetical protein
MYMVCHSGSETYTLANTLEDAAKEILFRITNMEEEDGGILVYKVEKVEVNIDSNPRITFPMKIPIFE